MIVVPCPERAERILLAGAMRCPRCGGRLRPHGHGRARTVREACGANLTVRPRRAECAGCGRTQILLPTTLTARRADSTAVIGAALAARADGEGYRRIAARLGRPVSTVRNWLRRVPDSHVEWLWQRGVQRAVEIDRELLAGPFEGRSPLWRALNLLVGVALAYRQRLGIADGPWSLMCFFAEGRLLAPPPFS